MTSKFSSGKSFFDYKDGGYYLGNIHTSLNQMMIIFGVPEDLTSQNDEIFDEVDLIEIQEEMGVLDYGEDDQARLEAKRIDYKWDILLEGRILGHIRGACADYEYCDDAEMDWGIYSTTPPQTLMTGEDWHELANIVSRMLGRYKNIKYDFQQLFFK